MPYIWRCIAAEYSFYLDLSTEAGEYKESNIGSVEIVNGKNAYDEPQAKILAHIRQGLGLEPYIDNAMSKVNRPPGFAKVITLTFDNQYRDKYDPTNLVGVRLPIRRFEIEVQQGFPNAPSKKWRA